MKPPCGSPIGAPRAVPLRQGTNHPGRAIVCKISHARLLPETHASMAGLWRNLILAIDQHASGAWPPACVQGGPPKAEPETLTPGQRRRQAVRHSRNRTDCGGLSTLGIRAVCDLGRLRPRDRLRLRLRAGPQTGHGQRTGHELSQAKVRLVSSGNGRNLTKRT